MIFFVLKGVWSALSFALGHLTSAVPFLMKLWGQRSDNSHELEMKRLDVELAKDKSVAQVTELAAQVTALQSTLEARVELATIAERAALEKAMAAHQAAGDRIEEKIIDTTSLRNLRKDLPYPKPKNWFQNLVNFLVVITDVVNAWMRPVSFAVILTTDVLLVWMEFDLLNGSTALSMERVQAFATLGAVEVLTDALPMILGVLWGERSHQHRAQGK